MVPPAITGFSKRVPPEGDTICGKFVPGGTDIFVNVCEMLRNREVFGADADTFRPERFLEGDEAKTAQLIKHVDLVFGHGRWMCPGKTLAWIELNKIFVEVSLPLFTTLYLICRRGTDNGLALEVVRFSDCEPGDAVAL